MTDTINFIHEEFVDSIKIHPKEIRKDMQTSILDVLRKEKEGICTNHGFIKKGSIKICEIGPGKVELSTFHGYLNYLVRYSAQVCNPVKDNIVGAKVVNQNNFGILCTSMMKQEEDGVESPILEIIVPKHSPAFVSQVDLDSINTGDNVLVQIIGKKYQLYNKKISIIGKIVVDESTRIVLDKNDEVTRGILPEEDDAISQDSGDEDDDNDSSTASLDDDQEGIVNADDLDEDDEDDDDSYGEIDSELSIDEVGDEEEEDD